MTCRKGAPSHVGLAVMVNAVAPSASVATSYSSTLLAGCPGGVFTKSITLNIGQRGARAYPCLG
eukprot:3578627-Pyramimonas_sp.AAC.1